MHKKRLCFVAIIIVILLASCGSKKDEATDNQSIINTKDVMDVYFSNVDNNVKTYILDMSEKCDNHVRIGDFEFYLEDVINESKTGYCFYKMRIKSSTVNVGEMSVSDGIYLMYDDKYQIEITPNGCYYTDWNNSTVISHKVDIINNNEAYIYGCFAYENCEEIDFQIWEKNGEEVTSEKGSIEVPNREKAVRFDITEDLHCWISPFGMKEEYSYGSNELDSVKEIILVMKDGSEKTVHSESENVNTGYNSISDGKHTTRIRQFEGVIRIEDISYLTVDGKVYKMSEIAEKENEADTTGDSNTNKTDVTENINSGKQSSGEMNKYIDAISKYFENSDTKYRDDYIVLIVPVIYYIDKSNENDIKIYGDFWKHNYTIYENQLNEKSWGENPGICHMKKDKDQYGMVSFESADDGQLFAESVLKYENEIDATLNPGIYDLYINSDIKMNAFYNANQVILYKYAVEKGLDSNVYKDHLQNVISLSPIKKVKYNNNIYTDTGQILYKNADEKGDFQYHGNISKNVLIRIFR